MIHTPTYKRASFPIALYRYLFKSKDPCKVCIVQATCTQLIGDTRCRDKDIVLRSQISFRLRYNKLTATVKQLPFKVLKIIRMILLTVLIISFVLLELFLIIVIVYNLYLSF